jgi:hypothetical protein
MASSVARRERDCRALGCDPTSKRTLAHPPRVQEELVDDAGNVLAMSAPITVNVVLKGRHDDHDEHDGGDDHGDGGMGGDH